MRVTGGELKGWTIPGKFPEHVRPTTDMMREAIFNKLSHTYGIEGMEVLDLFSGSGMVSLEFISRGAAAVLSIDKDAKNIALLKQFVAAKNIQNWQLSKIDVHQFLKTNDREFDIVFADPPYDMKGFAELPTLCMPSLKKGGILLLEHRPGTSFNSQPLELRKHGSSAIAIFAKE
jgi:16S rRNA (guanine966-N2)-methyltransferase